MDIESELRSELNSLLELKTTKETNISNISKKIITILEQPFEKVDEKIKPNDFEFDEKGKEFFKEHIKGYLEDRKISFTEESLNFTAISFLAIEKYVQQGPLGSMHRLIERFLRGLKAERIILIILLNEKYKNPESKMTNSELIEVSKYKKGTITRSINFLSHIHFDGNADHDFILSRDRRKGYSIEKKEEGQSAT